MWYRNQGVAGAEPASGAKSLWGCSSVDRVPDLHSGGRGFESHQLHVFRSNPRLNKMVKLTGLEPVVVRHSEFESLIGDQNIGE